MVNSLLCPQCGTPLTNEESEGLCPACLVAAALKAPLGQSRSVDEPSDADADTWSPDDVSETDQPTDASDFPDVPRYRIIRRLGVGGMGEVFEAEQQYPRRHVALKIVRTGLTTPRLLRRLVYEADVLARLAHTGIAQVYESGTTETGGRRRPFFAMELVRGPEGSPPQSLTQFADAQKLGTRQRLELLAKVADAVHHAHQKGIIHRDLKPSNVLVDASGQPKVLDFGVARVTDADVRTTTLHTDVGQIIGTLPYMSPEQAKGNPEEVDTRTDVYGLGAIAYELLAGRPPLDLRRVALAEAVRMIREQEPPTLSSTHHALRGDVETIVLKALAKEKDVRYASAAELAADVRRYLADEPITARRPTARYHLAKFARRNKPLAAAVAAALIVLCVGVVTTTWQAIRAKQSAARSALAEQSAKRRFDQAWEMARYPLKLDTQLRDIVGTRGVRSQLVPTSTLFLDHLSREANLEPKLRVELAEALLQLSQIQYDLADRPAIGTDALRTARKGLAIVEAVTAADPDDAVAQALLNRSYIEVSGLEQATSQLGPALQHARLGAAGARGMISAHPGDWMNANACNTTLLNAATQLNRLGVADEAIAAAGDALATNARLAAEQPGFVKAGGFLSDVPLITAVCHTEIAIAYGTLDRPRDALHHLDQASRFFDAEAAANATHRQFQQGRLRALLLSAEYLLRAEARDVDKAVSVARTAMGTARLLAQREPSSRDARQAIGMAEGILGLTLASTGDFTNAIDHLDTARLTHYELVAADPFEMRGRLDLCYRYNALGFAYSQKAASPVTPQEQVIGAWSDAYRNYRSAVDIATWNAHRGHVINPGEAEPVLPTNVAGLAECRERLKQGGLAMFETADVDAMDREGRLHFRVPGVAGGEEPGDVLWRQKNQTSWVRRYELSGAETDFIFDSRSKVSGLDGSVLRQDGGMLKAFVPDHPEGLQLQIWPAGATGWTDAGIMVVERPKKAEAHATGSSRNANSGDTR